MIYLKYKDEKRNIHLHHDVEKFNLKKYQNNEINWSKGSRNRITRTSKYDFNKGNHLNNTPSHKSNHADTGDKLPDRNNHASHTWQNEGGTSNRRRILISHTTMKNIEGWRLNKIIKSAVAVISIPGAKAEGIKHLVRGCLEDNSPDTAYFIPYFRTNNLKTNESIEDIATEIMDLAIFAKKEKNCWSGWNNCQKWKV